MKMNLYEETIINEMKSLNDADLLTNVDIERNMNKILIYYKKRIKELQDLRKR